MKTKTGVVGLLLCQLGSVQADTWSAMQLYQQQDYRSAQLEFNRVVLPGNSLAAYNLAVMAYFGQGENRNLIKAHSFALLAKALGTADADPLLKKNNSEINAAELLQAETEAGRLIASAVPGYQVQA